MFAHPQATCPPELNTQSGGPRRLVYLREPPRLAIGAVGVARSEPRREKVRILLYGSLPAIDRMINILYVKDFAGVHGGSDPLPTERPGEWLVVLTKQLIME